MQSHINTSLNGLWNIRIEVINHARQRYDTCGDWFFDAASDELVIRVSAMRNWKYELLVALHEIEEAALCAAATPPITQKAVDDFDIRGAGANLEDPGSSLDAPYHKQHEQATALERIKAVLLNVDWAEYEAAVHSL